MNFDKLPHVEPTTFVVSMLAQWIETAVTAWTTSLW